MIKEHPVYKGYFADEEGNLYSTYAQGHRYIKVALRQIKYFFNKNRGRLTRRFSIYNKTLYAHRFTWECFNGLIPKHLTIDHINRIRTDNRLKNLRLATIFEQSKNTSKQKRKTYSKFKGVSYYKNGKKWNSKATINGIRKYLGSFTTELEAAKAYDEVASQSGYTTNKDLGLI